MKNISRQERIKEVRSEECGKYIFNHLIYHSTEKGNTKRTLMMEAAYKINGCTRNFKGHLMQHSSSMGW